MHFIIEINKDKIIINLQGTIINIDQVQIIIILEGNSANINKIMNNIKIILTRGNGNNSIKETVDQNFKGDTLVKINKMEAIKEMIMEKEEQELFNKTIND
jgi:acylphosphatase